jgi:hypothetical protein
MSDVAEMNKPLSICGLRREMEDRPQLKFRVAATLSEVLRKEGLELGASALGSLSFCSYDELEKMGVRPPHGEWTI